MVSVNDPLLETTYVVEYYHILQYKEIWFDLSTVRFVLCYLCVKLGQYNLLGMMVIGHDT